jgi:membrane protein YqaA with SNARE-associated domain
MIKSLIPYLLVFVFGVTGSAFFLPNCEVALLGMANVQHVPSFHVFHWTINLSHYQAHLPFALAICIAAGSTVGSALFYLMGTGSVKLSDKIKKKVESFNTSRLETAGTALIFVSAVSSVPPITPIAFAAGVVKYRFWEYAVVSFVGKVIRFTIVVYAGQGVVTFIKHFF